MHNIENYFLSLPISTTKLNVARSLASQVSSLSIKERLKHNTLAVLVVRDYLEMMGIATNLEASDCWNPVLQICADVADLQIEGMGKLECRSLLADETMCYVPPEVWEDRIGYAIVQFETSFRSAKLLGFVSQVSTEFITIDHLEPIESLLDTLQEITTFQELTFSFQSAIQRYTDDILGYASLLLENKEITPEQTEYVEIIKKQSEILSEIFSELFSVYTLPILEIKNRFLGESHFIRTPINSMCGYASLLLEDTELIPKLSDLVRIIKQEAENLQYEVGNVLKFYRSGSYESVTVKSNVLQENLSVESHITSGVLPQITNLSNWLRDIFESGWQDLENLIDGKQIRYAYRTREISNSFRNNPANLEEVRRGILFDLGFEMPNSLFAMIAAISQITENEMNIRLAIYPISDMCLPEFLKLVVVDASGNTFLQTQARSIDNYIQLQFRGSLGERFSVTVSLENKFWINNFLV